MPVQRKLQPNEIYIINEVLPPLDPKSYVGYKLRVTLQLADDHLPRRFLAVEGVLLQGPEAGQKVLLQGVRLRRDEGQRPVCSCRAYPYPHHKGKGSCYASSEPPFCGDCGRPCTPVAWKESTHSEAWGVRQLDHSEGVDSSCCHADLYEDAELTKKWSE